MLKWFLAAIGIAVLSMAISAAHMHLSSSPSRRPYDAAAEELSQQVNLQYEPVSLISLFAAPERYDGRKVRVGGFVTLGFEDLGLHLDASSYQAGLRRNALRLDRPDWLTAAATRRLNRRYGEVAGTFEASDQEKYGYSGTLTQLRRIRPTFTQSDFMRWRMRSSREVLMQELLSGWFLSLVGWMALATLWALTRRGS
jgi:hypothetical protein